MPPDNMLLSAQWKTVCMLTKGRVHIVEVSGGDCPLTDEHFGLSFGTPGGSSLTSQGILSSEAMDILKAPYSEILQLSAAALHRRVEEVHHYQHPQRIVPLYQVAIQHFLCTSNLPESHGSILQAILRASSWCLKCHILGTEDGIHPLADKVRAIMETPAPHNVRELKSYLGLLSYYGKFLPDLSSVLVPLYHLLRKHVSCRWSAAERCIPGLKGPIVIVITPGAFWSTCSAHLSMWYFSLWGGSSALTSLAWWLGASYCTCIMFTTWFHRITYIYIYISTCTVYISHSKWQHSGALICERYNHSTFYYAVHWNKWHSEIFLDNTKPTQSLRRRSYRRNG